MFSLIYSWKYNPRFLYKIFLSVFWFKLCWCFNHLHFTFSLPMYSSCIKNLYTHSIFTRCWVQHINYLADKLYNGYCIYQNGEWMIASAEYYFAIHNFKNKSFFCAHNSIVLPVEEKVKSSYPCKVGSYTCSLHYISCTNI